MVYYNLITKMKVTYFGGCVVLGIEPEALHTIVLFSHNPQPYSSVYSDSLLVCSS